MFGISRNVAGVDWLVGSMHCGPLSFAGCADPMSHFGRFGPAVDGLHNPKRMTTGISAVESGAQKRCHAIWLVRVRRPILVGPQQVSKRHGDVMPASEWMFGGGVVGRDQRQIGGCQHLLSPKCWGRDGSARWSGCVAAQAVSLTVLIRRPAGRTRSPKRTMAGSFSG